MRHLRDSRDVAAYLNAEAASFPGIEFSTWFSQGEEVVEPPISPDVVRAFGKVLVGMENTFPGYAPALPASPTVADVNTLEPGRQVEFFLEVFVSGQALATVCEPILDGARLALVAAGVMPHTFNGPKSTDLSESMHTGFAAVAASFVAWLG